MANEPAPDFGESTLPAVATLLASLKAGEAAKELMHRAMDSAPTNIPITAASGTPLEEIAEFTRGEVSDLMEMAAKRGVTAKIMAASQGDSFYSPRKTLTEKILRRLPPEVLEGAETDLRVKGFPGGLMEHIGLGSASMPTAMHEIGHAAPILGSARLRGAWQRLGSILNAPVADAGRLALFANAIKPGEDDGPAREFARNHATALMAASYAPELLEEARATGLALMDARKLGPGAGAVAREMLPALGTYAAHAAGPVAGVYLAKKIMEALRNRGEEKKAEATAGKEVQSPGLLRAPASSAWHMGVSPPKPKSIKPNSNPSARAKETTKAKPPSKQAYFSDVIKTLNNPQRGFRLAKIG